MLSTSSANEDSGSQPWSATTPPSRRKRGAIIQGVSAIELNAYGCVKPSDPDQHYEIPMSFSQLAHQFGNEPVGHEYESELDECFNEDVRVNPLYSTSEDEI